MDPIQPQVAVATPKKSLGPLIGIIVIIALLVIGALFFWSGKLSKTDGNPRDMAAPTVAPVSNSDEVSAIDADLQADNAADIDLSGLDSI